MFALLFSLRPISINVLIVVTQIRGHIVSSFPPLPTTVRALHFFREKISALSLTRVELCLPFFFFFFCKYIQNLATAGFELTDQH